MGAELLIVICSHTYLYTSIFSKCSIHPTVPFKPRTVTELTQRNPPTRSRLVSQISHIRAVEATINQPGSWRPPRLPCSPTSPSTKVLPGPPTPKVNTRSQLIRRPNPSPHTCASSAFVKIRNPHPRPRNSQGHP